MKGLFTGSAGRRARGYGSFTYSARPHAEESASNVAEAWVSAQERTAMGGGGGDVFQQAAATILGPPSEVPRVPRTITAAESFSQAYETNLGEMVTEWKEPTLSSENSWWPVVSEETLAWEDATLARVVAQRRIERLRRGQLPGATVDQVLKVINDDRQRLAHLRVRDGEEPSPEDMEALRRLQRARAIVVGTLTRINVKAWLRAIDKEAARLTKRIPANPLFADDDEQQDGWWYAPSLYNDDDYADDDDDDDEGALALLPPPPPPPPAPFGGRICRRVAPDQRMCPAPPVAAEPPPARERPDRDGDGGGAPSATNNTTGQTAAPRGNLHHGYVLPPFDAFDEHSSVTGEPLFAEDTIIDTATTPRALAHAGAELVHTAASNAHELLVNTTALPSFKVFAREWREHVQRPMNTSMNTLLGDVFTLAVEATDDELRAAAEATITAFAHYAMDSLFAHEAGGVNAHPHRTTLREAVERARHAFVESGGAMQQTFADVIGYAQRATRGGAERLLDFSDATLRAMYDSAGAAHAAAQRKWDRTRTDVQKVLWGMQVVAQAMRAGAHGVRIAADAIGGIPADELEMDGLAQIADDDPTLAHLGVDWRQDTAWGKLGAYLARAHDLWVSVYRVAVHGDYGILEGAAHISTYVNDAVLKPFNAWTADPEVQQRMRDFAARDQISSLAQDTAERTRNAYFTPLQEFSKWFAAGVVKPALNYVSQVEPPPQQASLAASLARNVLTDSERRATSSPVVVQSFAAAVARQGQGDVELLLTRSLAGPNTLRAGGGGGALKQSQDDVPVGLFAGAFGIPSTTLERFQPEPSPLEVRARREKAHVELYERRAEERFLNSQRTLQSTADAFFSYAFGGEARAFAEITLETQKLMMDAMYAHIDAAVPDLRRLTEGIRAAGGVSNWLRNDPGGQKVGQKLLAVFTAAGITSQGYREQRDALLLAGRTAEALVDMYDAILRGGTAKLSEHMRGLAFSYLSQLSVTAAAQLAQRKQGGLDPTVGLNILQALLSQKDFMFAETPLTKHKAVTKDVLSDWWTSIKEQVQRTASDLGKGELDTQRLG